MHDLTGFQRDLLYQLEKMDNPNGQQIMQRLQERYPTEIHHGRLYPNLDTLVEKGLVVKGNINRRSNFYKLSERGQRELQKDKEWRYDD